MTRQQKGGALRGDTTTSGHNKRTWFNKRMRRDNATTSWCSKRMRGWRNERMARGNATTSWRNKTTKGWHNKRTT
jgi:hypothetical protein